MTKPCADHNPHQTDTTSDTPAWNSRAFLRAATRATGITGSQRSLLIHLEVEYSSWTTGGDIRPSCATLARNLGITRQAVDRHMRALVAAGWLTTVRAATKNEPAHYRLSYGEHLPVDKTGPEGPVSGSLDGPPDVTTEPAQRHQTRASRRNSLMPPTQQFGASDATNCCVATQQFVARTLYLNSVKNSSSSARPASDEPSPDQPQTKPDDDFYDFIESYPHPQSRHGTARRNAYDAYDAARTAGHEPHAIRAAADTDPECRTSWANAWLGELTARSAGLSWPDPQADSYQFSDEGKPWLRVVSG